MERWPALVNCNHPNAAPQLHFRKICTTRIRARHRKSASRNPQTLAKSRINTGPDKAFGLQLHNSRVTRLWTGCTRLTNKKLETHEFD